MSYLYDRDSSGGERFSYIRDDIPTKLLKNDFGTNTENFSLKLIYINEICSSMTVQSA